MKKFFCMMILVVAMIIGGCAEKENVTPKENPLPQVKKTDEAKQPSTSQPVNPPAKKDEGKIFELGFENTGGKGLRVSSGAIGGSSSSSTNISNGRAQISFKIPDGFGLLGSFNISDGQIFVQALDGQNVLFENTLTGSQEISFDFLPGNYTFYIHDLRQATGKIILRLVSKK